MRAGEGSAAGISRVTLGVGVARADGPGEVVARIICVPIGTMGIGAMILVTSDFVEVEGSLGERLLLGIGERVNLGGELMGANEV